MNTGQRQRTRTRTRTRTGTTTRPEANRIHELPIKITYTILPPFGASSNPTLPHTHSTSIQSTPPLVAYSKSPISCFVHPTSSPSTNQTGRTARPTGGSVDSSKRGLRGSVVSGSGFRLGLGLGLGGDEDGRYEEEEEEQEREGFASVYLKGLAVGIVLASPELDPSISSGMNSDHTIYIHCPGSGSGSVPSSASSCSYPSSSSWIQPPSSFPHLLPRHRHRHRQSLSSRGSLSKALSEPGYGITLVQGVLKRSVEFGSSGKRARRNLGPGRGGDDGRKPAKHGDRMDEMDEGDTSIGMGMGVKKGMGGLAALMAEEEERRAGNRSGAKSNSDSGSDSDECDEHEHGGRPGIRSTTTRSTPMALGGTGFDSDSANVRNDLDREEDEEEEEDEDRGAWGVEVVISLRRFDASNRIIEWSDRSVTNPTSSSAIDLTLDGNPLGSTRPLDVPIPKSILPVGPRITVSSMTGQLSSPAIARPVQGTHKRTGSLLGEEPMRGGITGSVRGTLRSGSISSAGKANVTVNVDGTGNVQPSSSSGGPNVLNGASSTALAPAPAQTQIRTQAQSQHHTSKPIPTRKPNKKPKTSHECSNCGITESVTWRQRNGLKVCNACGMYWNAKRQMRPKELWGNTQKALRKKRQHDFDLSSDAGGPNVSTSTSLALPLSSSFVPNLPIGMNMVVRDSPPPMKPTTLSTFAHSRFQPQPQQSRKRSRARFEDQVSFPSSTGPNGVGAPGGSLGLGGHVQRGLTARGMTTSGFKRTLSMFAEGESVVRAEKRRGGRGGVEVVGGLRVGVGMERMGTGTGIGDVSPVLNGGDERRERSDGEHRFSVEHVKMKDHPSHPAQQHQVKLVGLGLPLSDDSGNTIIPALPAITSINANNPTSTNLNTTISEPAPASVPVIQSQAPLSAHNSFEFNGMIDWDANTDMDLEALFRLSQESGQRMEGGSQEAVAMSGPSGGGLASDEFGKAGWMGMDGGRGVGEASTSEDNLAFLNGMFMDTDGSSYNGQHQNQTEHQHTWNESSLLPQHLDLQIDTTPEFDFSQLPPSSPPLLVHGMQVGMEGYGQSHPRMVMSSPGTEDGDLGYGF